MSSRSIVPSWRSGYSVTFHNTASMRFQRFPRLSQALEAAQAHALRASAYGSADVTPCKGATFRFNGRQVESVRYWCDREGLQFTTNERAAG